MQGEEVCVCVYTPAALQHSDEVIFKWKYTCL